MTGLTSTVPDPGFAFALRPTDPRDLGNADTLAALMVGWQKVVLSALARSAIENIEPEQALEMTKPYRDTLTLILKGEVAGWVHRDEHWNCFGLFEYLRKTFPGGADKAPADNDELISELLMRLAAATFVARNEKGGFDVHKLSGIACGGVHLMLGAPMEQKLSCDGRVFVYFPWQTGQKLAS